MALKNISLSEIASWVYYFYLFHRVYTWPRISARKGRANFALPVTSPYSSTVIRNLDVDTPDTRKAQSEPERRPIGAPPEPDGPYLVSFKLKPCSQLHIWLTCGILVFMDREARFLMVIDIRKCHVWICFSWTFLPHFSSCLLTLSLF